MRIKGFGISGGRAPRRVRACRKCEFPGALSLFSCSLYYNCSSKDPLPPPDSNTSPAESSPSVAPKPSPKTSTPVRLISATRTRIGGINIAETDQAGSTGRTRTT